MSDVEGNKRRIFEHPLINTLVAVVLGGLIGWWLAQPKEAVLSYTVTSTTTGADAHMKALVPDLAVTIGGKSIDALHTHVVEITPTGGYVKEGSIAVIFPSPPPHVFGFTAEAPSTVHSIQCKPAQAGFTCNLLPLDSRVTTPYRIRIATNLSTPPTLLTATEHVEVATAQELLRRRNRPSDYLTIIGGILSVVFIVLLFVSYLKAGSSGGESSAIKDIKISRLESRLMELERKERTIAEAKLADYEKRARELEAETADLISRQRNPPSNPQS